MTVVKENFINETIEADDERVFVDCVFLNCSIVISIRDAFSHEPRFIGCRFTDCKITDVSGNGGIK